ncbi:hypothetical protein AGRA3207_005047 [Actinomadura graeca]|uniref:Band 7 domain-containing protein n=1 Tax=Actinomadura graeca TaxID=2750812 RepID=A0ABX8QYG6_9ACTN|nr:SPFH domain-containing protein [Actinomadura graeca]QXJ23835.1 hypothetical protein AGRA3207_005047 [Actinomadura graeca]
MPIFGYVVYTRFRVTPPNTSTAVVFSGGGLWGFKTTDGARLRVVLGRAQFVPPPHRGRREIPLAVEDIPIEAKNCETKQQLRVNIIMALSYRIEDKKEHIRRAAVRLPMQPESRTETIRNLAHSKLTEVVSETEHDDLNTRRQSVVARVRDAITEAFTDYGLVVQDVGFTSLDDLDEIGKARRSVAQISRRNEVIEAEQAGRLKATELETQADIDRKRLEEEAKVEKRRLEAEAAERQHELLLRTNSIEHEVAEITAERERHKAKLAAEKDLEEQEHRRVKAERTREARRVELEIEKLESDFRTERASAERLALNATEHGRQMDLAVVEEVKLLSAARAKGLETASRIKGLTGDEIKGLVMLAVAEQLGEVAKSRPDLSNLRNVSVNGDGSGGLLSQLTAMGGPALDMVGEFLKGLKEGNLQDLEGESSAHVAEAILEVGRESAPADGS